MRYYFPPQLESVFPLPCKSQDVHILSILTTVITNILHQILNFSHPHMADFLFHLV